MNRLPFCRYVFWYHNERMVNYDVGRGITVFTSNAPDKTQSRFNIKEATPADSGNYTCNPSNAVPASIQVFVSKGRGELRTGGREELVFSCGKADNSEPNSSSSFRQR